MVNTTQGNMFEIAVPSDQEMDGINSNNNNNNSNMQKAAEEAEVDPSEANIE